MCMKEHHITLCTGFKNKLWETYYDVCMQDRMLYVLDHRIYPVYKALYKRVCHIFPKHMRKDIIMHMSRMDDLIKMNFEGPIFETLLAYLWKEYSATSVCQITHMDFRRWLTFIWNEFIHQIFDIVEDI